MLPHRLIFPPRFCANCTHPLTALCHGIRCEIVTRYYKLISDADVDVEISSDLHADYAGNAIKDSFCRQLSRCQRTRWARWRECQDADIRHWCCWSILMSYSNWRHWTVPVSYYLPAYWASIVLLAGVCRLSASSVTLPADERADHRRVGGWGGRQCTASQYGYVPLRWHLVYDVIIHEMSLPSQDNRTKKAVEHNSVDCLYSSLHVNSVA